MNYKKRKVVINMKIKRMLCIMATFVISMGAMTGCGSGTGNSSNNTTATTKNATQAATTQSTTGSINTDIQAGVKTDSTSNKTLVVYYSATGSTKAVAETIAGTTNADIFEITPVKPYTNDDLNWRNNSSRVSKEHDDVSLRNVELTQTTPNNWADYNTIFIGYPIWWGIAAWPVDNFIKANDFNGKTVIPFCTSTSSGMGESGTLLQKMAGTGNWQEGERFSSGVSSSNVQKWVNSLNLNK